MRFTRTALFCSAWIAAGAGPALAAGVGLERSDTCGQCHRDIFRMWRSSAHARALEDPVFLEAFRVTTATEGTEVARVCLSCHAPAAQLTGDWKLERKTTWDGVSCEICHSIVAVETFSGAAHMTLDVSNVKRGPIADAQSSGHEVAYSALHTEALACAPCHEFKNAEGLPIMTTYSEWRGSSSAKAGTSCQACHMARTKADIVDPRIGRTPRAEVNVHDVPGGHSLEMLQKAVRVSLAPGRVGGDVVLEVRLRNQGAGHAVPTGMPGRRVILDVRGRTSAGETFEERRVYTKSFASATGAEIRRDSGFFARGVRLTGDTRLAADEERRETFRFAVAPSASATLSVRLHYEHTPTDDETDRTWITFFAEERAVPRAAGG